MCENCLKLARKCLAYQGEITNLERRVEELEEALDISEQPEESYSETRRQMIEDRD